MPGDDFGLGRSVADDTDVQHHPRILRFPARWQLAQDRRKPAAVREQFLSRFGHDAFRRSDLGHGGDVVCYARPNGGLFQLSDTGRKQKTLTAVEAQRRKIIDTYIEIASAKPVPRRAPFRRPQEQKKKTR